MTLRVDIMKKAPRPDTKSKGRDDEKDRRRSRDPKKGGVRPGGTAPGKEQEPRPTRPAAKGRGTLTSKKGSKR